MQVMNNPDVCLTIIGVIALIVSILALCVARNANSIAIKIHAREVIAPFAKYAWNLRWKLRIKPLSNDNIDEYLKMTEQAMVDVTPYDEQSCGIIDHIYHMLTAMKTIPHNSDRESLRDLIVDTIDATLQ